MWDLFQLYRALPDSIHVSRVALELASCVLDVRDTPAVRLKTACFITLGTILYVQLYVSVVIVFGIVCVGHVSAICPSF